MNNVDILFGINAGKIWKALDSGGALTKIQLMNKIRLNENDLDRSIGWLARENKIKKDGEFYFLDQTNLSEKIQNNAEKIWNSFNKGKINMDKLADITRMDQENYDLALGWLAREGRLKDDIITIEK